MLGWMRYFKFWYAPTVKEEEEKKTGLMKMVSNNVFRFGDEKKLMQFHQELEDVIEDQLSLGANRGQHKICTTLTVSTI